MKINWTFFTERELQCPCCKACGMDSDFMDRLIRLRRDLGFAFPVSSGYRCAAHNQQVSNTQTSAHTYGRAVDVKVSGNRAWAILVAAPSYGFTGIGVQQKGPVTGRFIHLDDMPNSNLHPRPRVWSY